MNTKEYTNKLSEETSPYLLQHAHNPVNWHPWGEEALQLAKEENKPIIVSIGYSACHWCHVMERESFENEAAAEIMNEHFVCIKVDREERPDVDQIYMDAIQAMGIQGGWPLNVFLTQEQKPFYGGTYFPAETWKQLLNNVATAYKSERAALEESADKFTEALNLSDINKYNLSPEEFIKDDAITAFNNLSQAFDSVNGGMSGAPKFPMPGIWSFVLHYLSITKDENAQNHLQLTLKKMALGGIYDQVGGGFSRYSVDKEWFAPHFEKMLYDNGQLLSLYSEAYRFYKDDFYKEVVYQTISFVERELSNDEGGFYAALDADSEGEEGKFYTWTEKDFNAAVGEDSEELKLYFNVTKGGNWEKDWNILHQTRSLQDFVVEKNLDFESFSEKIQIAKKRLLEHRSKRIRPGLDDKILAGWNGLMLKGIIDAYISFKEDHFIELALKNAHFIKNNLIKNANVLFRTYKGGKTALSGYLEDYASVIGAFKSLYEVTFDEQWLESAKELTKYVLDHFYDEEEKLFFFTDNATEKLIARKKEIFDNVIPSSNALMAANLYDLGLLLDHEKWKQIAKEMVSGVKKLIVSEPRFMNVWADVLLKMVYPTAEVAIVGPKASEYRLEFGRHAYFNSLYVGTKETSILPLLKNRTTINNQTTIYVCYNKACQLPVNKIEDAIKQINFN